MHDLVKVYWNSRKKCFSICSQRELLHVDALNWQRDDALNWQHDTVKIKSKNVWRVTKYASAVRLLDCQFVVQPSGRRRAQQERRKNVHAWILGRHSGSINADWSWPAPSDWDVEVSYSPFTIYESFVTPDRQNITWGKEVWALRDGKSPRILVKGPS
jgi:hypothetical protein